MSTRFILLLVIIHGLFVLPLFRPGLLRNHDAELHTARFAAYYKSFAAGNIPPRWAGDLNYGYGTPLFIFYAPLTGYLGSFVHSVGMNFESSYKLVIALAFIAAPITFYFFMVSLFPPWTSFLASVVYGLVPYHFLDLYVRGAVAELLALAVAPLIPLSVEKLHKKLSVRTVLMGGIVYGLLILSQNIIAVMFTVVGLLYGFIRFFQKRSALFYVFGMLLLGLGLSAFYWIPAVFEQQFTHSTLFIGTKYLDHYPTITQLIRSPWGFGPDVGKPGGLSPRIGILHIILTAVAVVLMRKTGKNDRWFTYWAIAVFVLSVFLALRISSFVWMNVSVLQKFEFPWRFIAVASFATAVLSAVVFEKVKQRFLHILFLFVILLSSLSYVSVPPSLSRADAYYASYGPSTDFGAATPVWTAGDPATYPQKPVSVIAGSGTVTDIERAYIRHAFVVTNQTDVTILDNTLYFPGWQVRVDGQKVPIQFQDPNHRGLLTFSVPKGRHRVDVSFHDSPLRSLANAVSIGTLLFLLLAILRIRNHSYTRS